jgi:hypothetical protein
MGLDSDLTLTSGTSPWLLAARLSSHRWQLKSRSTTLSNLISYFHTSLPKFSIHNRLINMAKATTDNGAQKMVPADCISVLLMALGSTSISKAQYEMMSALDGTRTASSFEHQFRTITARAKELKARADQGEKFEPVAPAPKRGMCSCSRPFLQPPTDNVGGGTASPATPRKRKGTDGETSPAKKKATPKKKQTETPSDDDDGLPQNMEEFSTYMAPCDEDGC